MEKVWIMKCPNCCHELPQGLRRREVVETMKVNCPKCQWEGLAKNTSLQEMSFEDWMGPGYTKENSFLSQQDYEQMLNSEKGKVNLDAMFAGYNTPEPRFDRDQKKEQSEPRREEEQDKPPSSEGKSEEDDWGERIDNMVRTKFNPQQIENINRKIKKLIDVEINDPEAVEAWNKIKDLDCINPEVRKKWEELLAKKN